MSRGVLDFVLHSVVEPAALVARVALASAPLLPSFCDPGERFARVALASAPLLPSFGDPGERLTIRLGAHELAIAVPGADVHGLFAHRQWRAGLLLARAVLSLELAGKTVCELGAGTGLPGIAASLNGAAYVRFAAST